MRPVCEVIEARPWHVGQIIHRLRAEHLGCLARSGIERLEVHRELGRVFGMSAFRKAWIVDGELAALGGVTGTTLASQGFIWLALSQSVLRYPLEIIREAKKQLGHIMETKTELATTVLADDEVALRFSAFLQFHAQHRPGVMTWREQLALIRAAAPRLPIKGGFALALGYHEGAV